MGSLKPQIILLAQAIGSAALSVSAGSNFFASHVKLSTFMADSENGVLHVLYCSATTAALECIIDNGTDSTNASVIPYQGGNVTTSVVAGAWYNYQIPVMGDDAVNFSPNLGGTTLFFMAGLLV